MSLLLILTCLLALDVHTQRTYCRYRDRPVSTDKEDMFETIDVTLGENITMQCHFCGESDDGQPKNWFITKELEDFNEIMPSMETDIKLNKIVVNADHSLTIYNFSSNDSGIYYCRMFEEKEVNLEYNYFVDLVEKFYGDDESGNLTSWKKYHEDFLAPINKLFIESEGFEFVQVRTKFKLSLEAISHWEPWSKCVCDQPGGKRIRRKQGICKIKFRNDSIVYNLKNPDEIFLLKANEISCRSIRLKKIFPDISNRTKVIPNFIQSEYCEETCSLDNNGENRGWKVGKTKGFKYRKTFVLLEKSHLTLICPESTLENKVVWTKRGKSLKPGDASYPNMYVDSFNTLYLVNVTILEEGNYSCQVDDIQMQRIIVHIVSKSKFLSGELTRHMGYLGFILLLTVPCYCAGLVVTWWRRKTFETYEDYMKEKGKTPYLDDENESLL